MSIDEALKSLLTKAELERIPMGTNKVFMGDNDRYVEARLHKSYEASTYDRLVLTLFNRDKNSNSVSINLTDKRYAPTRDQWNNPVLQDGGYYWGHDNKFYNYAPRADLVGKEVNRLLKFWKVGAFGS